VEIYFYDLREDAQIAYLEFVGLDLECLDDPDSENLNLAPLAILEE